MKSPKAIAICLFLIFVVSTLLTYHFIDIARPDWKVTFWGIVGSNASVLGIVFALVQLHQIRKEAAIISETSNDTRNKLLELDHFGELAKATKLIQEIQGYSRSAKHEMAVMRLQEVKIIIVQAKGLKGKIVSDVDFDQILTKLNYLINGLEKEIETRSKSLKVAVTNGELETILDSLVKVQTQILTKR